MVRRRGPAGRSLNAIDGNLANLKEQLLALQARIDAADEDRLDVIAKATLDAFPEIDADEYGEDLDKFLQEMHDDALRYREAKAKSVERQRQQTMTSVEASDTE